MDDQCNLLGTQEVWLLRLTMRPASLRSARGFTIIEMMMTLTVFAILVMMVLPEVSSIMANARDRSVVGRFAQDFDWLRSRASTSAVSLTLNADCSWTATVDGATNADHSMTTATLTAMQANVSCAPAAVTPITLPATFNFTPQGYSSVTGRFMFQGSQGQTWTLQVQFSGTLLRINGAS